MIFFSTVTTTINIHIHSVLVSSSPSISTIHNKHHSSYHSKTFFKGLIYEWWNEIFSRQLSSSFDVCESIWRTSLLWYPEVVNYTRRIFNRDDNNKKPMPHKKKEEFKSSVFGGENMWLYREGNEWGRSGKCEKLRFCHQIYRETQNKKKFKPPICDSVKNHLSTDNVG